MTTCLRCTLTAPSRDAALTAGWREIPGGILCRWCAYRAKVVIVDAPFDASMDLPGVIEPPRETPRA